MPKHIFYQPEDIKEDDYWGQSNIIDGGLCLCKVCGCLEGGLATDCPGEKVKYDVQDNIYHGKIDFKDDKGWVNELNLTNISWLYGRYIRFHGSDITFCKNEKLIYEYFKQIKKKWHNEGWRTVKLEMRD